MPRNLESKLQQSCVTWFRLQYPQYRGLLFAIPNGGHRNIATAKRLKAEGVVAGVADLFFAKPKHESMCLFKHGLFIEMKFGKGKLSPSQKEFSELIRLFRYDFEVCSSFDEFKNLIEEYLK